MTKQPRLVLSLTLSLVIDRVGANFLIVALKGSQVLTSLGEFTFLHTLTNVPVDEGTLRVEEIELVVETAPSRRDGSGVGEHAQASRNLGKIAARDASRRFVADTKLEARRAPVDELDGSLGLMVLTAAFVSLATISPRYNKQQAMYFPSRGSHFTIWLPLSKQEMVISATEFCS